MPVFLVRDWWPASASQQWLWLYLLISGKLSEPETMQEFDLKYLRNPDMYTNMGIEKEITSSTVFFAPRSVCFRAFISEWASASSRSLSKIQHKLRAASEMLFHTQNTKEVSRNKASCSHRNGKQGISCTGEKLVAKTLSVFRLSSELNKSCVWPPVLKYILPKQSSNKPPDLSFRYWVHIKS